MKRIGAVVATFVGTMTIGLCAFVRPAPKLIWNASASVPIGLYAVHPARPLRLGDVVVARLPEPLASYMDARRSLPRGVPLMKPISALGGQTVCRHDEVVSVDGLLLVKARERDRLGRALPSWQGCRTLNSGEVFLVNPSQPDSLDGRYFGPLPSSVVVGRATPLWIPKAH